MAGAGSREGMGLHGGDGTPGRRGLKGRRSPGRACGRGACVRKGWGTSSVRCACQRCRCAQVHAEGRRACRRGGVRAQSSARARGADARKCMRKGGVRAEGVGYELSPVRVPEVQMRAVVRTHLVALLVLLVLRREANEVHRVAGCELHGRHHARGSLGGAERRELRLRRRGERAGGGYHHHDNEGEAHHVGYVRGQWRTS